MDTESFEVKSNVLACDRNKICAISTMSEGLQIFEPVDIARVVFVTSSYFADKYNLYHYNGHFIEYCHLDSDSKIKALQKKYSNVDAWWNYTDRLHKKLRHFKHKIYNHRDKFYYCFKESKFLYLYTLRFLYKYVVSNLKKTRLNI